MKSQKLKNTSELWKRKKNENDGKTLKYKYFSKRRKGRIQKKKKKNSRTSNSIFP